MPTELPEGFIPDEPQQAFPEGFIPDDPEEDPYYKAAKTLEDSAGYLMSGVGRAANFVDRFTGAPVRAAVGAAQKGQPSVPAFFNQFLREPSTAPSGKDIMARAGLSEEENISTPFRRIDMTPIKASPAGIAGGAAEMALDPLTYVPGIGAEKMLVRGGQALEKVAPRVSSGLARFAEERAVKAATGENRGAIRKLAKVKGQTGGDVDKAIANLRATGRTLLESDEAGAPAVGWFTSAEEIGENAAAKRRFYGKQIGNVGPKVDELAPGAITPEDLAKSVESFRDEIPNAGKGAPVRKRVAEEAENFRRYGLSEGEHGPAAPLKFADAQELKAQYPFEPQSPDILISDKDASNRVNRIISGHMDKAVDAAAEKELKNTLSAKGYTFGSANDGELLQSLAKDREGRIIGTVSGFKDPDGNLIITHASTVPEAQKQGLATSLISDMRRESGAKGVTFHGDQTQAGQALASSYATGNKFPLAKQYDAAKGKYGTYKNVADAGTEQAMRTLGRRMVSPSSHAMGLGTAMGVAQTAADLKTAGLWGAVSAAANQLLLSRGSAFAARSADAISKRVARAPQAFAKWRPLMEKAAKGGSAVTVGLHHQLMNNDPEYRSLMQAASEEP